MSKITQTSLQISLYSFLLVIFLSHANSQSLQAQEQAILLKLKQHWDNLPYMNEWKPSNSSHHCSWSGVTCIENSVTGLSFINIDIAKTIPPSLCGLKNLTVINLGDNYIPGQFPTTLYNCTKLEYLDLSNNYLIGTIPNDIDRMIQLQYLNLGGNNFTGDIPKNIGRLQNLTTLMLHQNLFNGSLPPEIGNLFNLEVLGLAFNLQLVPSKLPSNYTQLKRLKTLWMRMSNLIGEIPETIGDMVALEEINLSNNSLSGKIPSDLFTLKNLSRVYLYKNRLSGEIPQIVEALNLSDVDLSENNLTGKIPEGFENQTKLFGLTLFSNNLSGDIPMGIGSLPKLLYFNLFSNNLSGTLPPDLGKYSMLREFQVSSNRLNGNLPEHLCSGGNLVGVVAFDNSLSGELPKSLENCSGLLIVNVKKNNFSGNVPSGLWTSFNLTELMLSDNSFTGELPEKLAWNLSRLEISDNKFSGKIPNGVFSWKRLVVFIASNNLLTGPIPQELTALSSLTTLFLDRNKLEGYFPSNIISWRSLNTLNLSQNNIFGSLPEKLGLLPGLTDLDLSFNKFSGKIPSQLGSLRLIFLNLSSNSLTGIVPKAFENAAYANSFLNNPGLCANSQQVNLNVCNLKNLKTKNISPEFLALIVTCSVAIFLLTLILSIFIVKRYLKKQRVDPKRYFTSFQRLDFTESKILTGLTENNLIGSGGSGKVYRVVANFGGDVVVAVKKIWNKRKLEEKFEKQFQAEVKVLSSIRHSNIVKLLCCISSENSKLLVYEYIENGSLDRWLQRKNKPSYFLGSGSIHHVVLDWPKRLHIAVGAAQGLCYMHHDCVPPVLHCDIKPSNVLLDSNFNAKIADFGLAKLLIKQGEDATMSTFAGSFGYMAPECAQTTRVSEKIDVYSFGVILLELVTGRQANGGNEETFLVEWAWHHVQDGKPIVDAIDEDIKERCYLDEILSVFKLGIFCTETLPSNRPTMKEVLHALLRCSPPMAYGKNMDGNEYDVAPLLRNSKREKSLENDDDGLV